MPRTSNGTNSASNPSLSVSEKKARYQDIQKKLFEEAIEGAKKFSNPNRTSTASLNSFDRETIRGYLQAPANNEENLRNAARYLYYRSQPLYRLIGWYASMWDLRCRQVIPDYNLTKDNSPDKMKSVYEKTLKQLEIYDIHGNWHDVALRCYLEDVCYTVFFRDDKDSFFYILDPSECKIDVRYFTKEFGYSVDMSKWRSAQKRELAEWLGSPFTDMLDEYDRNGVRWVHMPDEYGAAFKFNSDRMDLVIPPMTPLLQSYSSLNDLADIQALKDQASIYKLLLVPMKVLASAKTNDEFEISPDILIEYYKKLSKTLPEYVAASIIPGEVTNDNVIDFSTTSADKDIDRLAQSQDTIMSLSGGGAVLNSNQINSTAAFNAWLKAETEFAISSLMPQIEGFTNRMLRYDVSGNPCRVRYFECSVYTKEEMKKSLLESCQYSFSNRLAYNTLNGISELATLAMEYMENEVLGLPKIMTHPLQSSYTSTGAKGQVGQGRDALPDDQIEPSTERSRNER